MVLAREQKELMENGLTVILIRFVIVVARPRERIRPEAPRREHNQRKMDEKEKQTQSRVVTIPERLFPNCTQDQLNGKWNDSCEDDVERERDPLFDGKGVLDGSVGEREFSLKPPLVG